MRMMHFSSREIKEEPASFAIEYEVSTVSESRGAIEELEAKVEKLTEILGKVVDLLPPDLQRKIVEDFFYWNPTNRMTK